MTPTNNFRRGWLLFSYGIAAALLLTASPGFFLRVFASDLATPPKRILRVRTLGDPLTLDWNRAYSPVESTLIRNVMEGLVAIAPVKKGGTAKVVPALAERWTISRDGRNYTFYLRKNVKWSDGQLLKAQHFVDSWRRLLTPSFNGNYAYLLFDLENAEAFHEGKITDFNTVGVKAEGEHVLTVRLRAPVAYWIWIPTVWSTFPVRQDLINGQTGQKGDWAAPGKLVSLGPFLYASYEPHRNVVLKRNPGYYGKRGNIDEISAALVEDESTAIRMYEDNQIDFITRLSTEVRRYSGRPDFVQWSEARIMHLDFNPHQKPTEDVRVRQALALAIDRSKLIGLLQGASGVASSLLPPSIPAQAPASETRFDPARARKLLEQAGYKEGKVLSLELVAAGYNDDVLTARFIAEELKKNLGVEVRVHTYEAKQFYSPLVSFGGFSMLLNRWTADFLDPDNIFSIFMSSSGNNRVGWKNADYDAKVVAARALLDRGARDKAYAALHRILVDENMVALPLYYGRNCAIVRPGIEGFEPTPTNSYLFKDFMMR